MLQIVPQADFKVVRVVRRGHLDRAGAEADLAVLIAHDRNFAIHNRQDAGLADQVLELFIVLGVDGNAGVAQHGLGTRRRDNDVAAAIAQRVADIPEMAGLVNVLDLRVGQGGHAVRTPVYHSAPLVDESLVIKLAERLAHGLGAGLIHGEAATLDQSQLTPMLFCCSTMRSPYFSFHAQTRSRNFLAAKVIAGLAFL